MIHEALNVMVGSSKLARLIQMTLDNSKRPMAEKIPPLKIQVERNKYSFH